MLLSDLTDLVSSLANRLFEAMPPVLAEYRVLVLLAIVLLLLWLVVLLSTASISLLSRFFLRRVREGRRRARADNRRGSSTRETGKQATGDRPQAPRNPSPGDTVATGIPVDRIGETLGKSRQLAEELGNCLSGIAGSLFAESIMASGHLLPISAIRRLQQDALHCASAAGTLLPGSHNVHRLVQELEAILDDRDESPHTRIGELLKLSVISMPPQNADTLEEAAGHARQLVSGGYFLCANSLWLRISEHAGQMWGEDDPRCLSARHNAATCLVTLGQPDEAGEILESVLEDRKRVLGEEHPDTLATLFAIGGIALSRGDHAGAIPILEEVYEKRRQTLGARHVHTMESLMQLAEAAFLGKDPERARNCYEELLAFYRRQYGNDHPHTRTCQARLADIQGTPAPPSGEEDAGADTGAAPAQGEGPGRDGRET